MFEFRIKNNVNKLQVLEFVETNDELYMKETGYFFWAYYKLLERYKHI